MSKMYSGPTQQVSYNPGAVLMGNRRTDLIGNLASFKTDHAPSEISTRLQTETHKSLKPHPMFSIIALGSKCRQFPLLPPQAFQCWSTQKQLIRRCQALLVATLPQTNLGEVGGKRGCSSHQYFSSTCKCQQPSNC